MKHIRYNIWILFLIAMGWFIQPAYGQQTENHSTKSLFIGQGKILAGFSLGFTNASREDFNFEFEREITDITLQVDGLYFVSDRIGIGPLLGYQFVYRDLEDPFARGDTDTWSSDFKFGAKGGFYVPMSEVISTSSKLQVFFDAGVSWLRRQFRREPASEPDIDYRFGYEIGTGILLPVGKRIALETRLGFETRRRKFTLGQSGPGFITEYKWPKKVTLGVGLKFTF